MGSPGKCVKFKGEQIENGGEGSSCVCQGLTAGSRQAPRSHLFTPAGSGRESEGQQQEALWVEI